MAAHPPTNFADVPSDNEAAESELDDARAYLRATPPDSHAAATLLWGAVSDGNTTAETLLADLYLRGDGVTKSCEQGRVLLTAAAKKGNSAAQQRLANLLAHGCR